MNKKCWNIEDANEIVSTKAVKILIEFSHRKITFRIYIWLGKVTVMLTPNNPFYLNISTVVFDRLG